MNKETRQLRKALKKQGFHVCDEGKHLKVYATKGGKIDRTKFVTMARTPSDHRAILNTIALLRRELGFKWKGR